jgi:tetratricopeptide (TPR) repeat protein
MSSYEYLLKGKEMHHQFSKDANAEALEMFDRAIESDPNNAQAYAWKACTLGQAFARNYINDTFEELSPVWDNLISTAIKIDPNDFECHRLLSAVYSGTKKYNLSLEHGKKAYDMVPNDPRILQQYGEALLKTGQTTEGCDLTLKALEYDPVPQGQINSNKRKSDAVFACFMDDRIDLGLELAEQISEPSVRDVLYSTCLAVSKTGGVDEYPWLQNVIKASDQNAFTDIIDDMKNIDLVIYNTLLQVYNETILAAFE